MNEGGTVLIVIGLLVLCGVSYAIFGNHNTDADEQWYLTAEVIMKTRYGDDRALVTKQHGVFTFHYQAGDDMANFWDRMGWPAVYEMYLIEQNGTWKIYDMRLKK